MALNGCLPANWNVLLKRKPYIFDTRKHENNCMKAHKHFVVEFENCACKLTEVKQYALLLYMLLLFIIILYLP